MQLIGMLDSPYVRRVAISLKRLGIAYEHKPLSVFRNFEEFSQINPLVKAPTLVCDDGTVLLDSTLILEYIEAIAGPAKTLMPADSPQLQQALRLIGIALGACDKTVQIVYERTLRPAEKQHQPWLDRVSRQLSAAYDLLEQATTQRAPWLLTDRLMQPDITVCVAWRFTQLMIPEVITVSQYPALAKFSEETEQLPEFIDTPLP
ncbi:MAG: glutathione S-transferase [Cyanobacteria bacterium P01_A01_bin.114]